MLFASECCLTSRFWSVVGEPKPIFLILWTHLLRLLTVLAMEKLRSHSFLLLLSASGGDHEEDTQDRRRRQGTLTVQFWPEQQKPFIVQLTMMKNFSPLHRKRQSPPLLSTAKRQRAAKVSRTSITTSRTRLPQGLDKKSLPAASL